MPLVIQRAHVAAWPFMPLLAKFGKCSYLTNQTNTAVTLLAAGRRLSMPHRAHTHCLACALPRRLLPSTCIVRRDVGYVLCTARLAQSQHVAAAVAAVGCRRVSGSSSASVSDSAAQWQAGAAMGGGDAALAALPALLDDPLLLGELLARWWGRVCWLFGANATQHLVRDLVRVMH